MGFRRGAVHEVILSTYDDDGSPRAAPMGVTTENLAHVVVKPYLTTSTYRNMRLRRCAVANVTNDPELFYHTAFKEEIFGGKLPSDWFGNAITVKAPRLKSAYAFLELSVRNVIKEGKKARIVCDVKLAEKRKFSVGPYCRATFATIESIIHATRVREFLKEGAVEEANRLVKLIKYYRNLVKRTNPSSTCEKILDDLIARIGSWKVRKNCNINER